MKLDNRIKSLSDILTCFDIEKAAQFIGEKGYFAGDLCNFSDIKLYCPYGTLDKVIDTDDAFQNREIFYPFFIPECNLKPAEKPYRPFTLSEFTDKFTIGRPIKFRPKGETEREMYLTLLGYRHIPSKDQTISYISIGHFTYLLDELFNEYEWQEADTGCWAPFGVEETE